MSGKLQHDKCRPGPVLCPHGGAEVGREHGVPGPAERSPPECWWACDGEPSLLNEWEWAWEVT